MRPYYVLFMFACVLGMSAAQQSNSERQVRLDDIERDNLKSSQQTPQQQQQQQQQQRLTPVQYQQAQYQQAPLIQYTPQFYQVPNPAPASAPGAAPAQLFAQPSINQGQLSAYHQQLIFSQPQQLTQPVLIPQHQALPFPVMLIPSSYLLPQQQQQQDVNSILYAGGLPQGYQQVKYAPAQAQQIQATSLKGGFRPSPQISITQYPTQQQYLQPQYNAYQTVYQQKYATGAKSTVAPPLKDNYVGQSASATAYANYKLQ